MKKPAFKIGQWVRVTHTISFHYESSGDPKTDERKIVRSNLTSNRDEDIGQIVGAKKRQLGKLIIPTYGYYGDDDRPYLHTEKTITTWLIKRGYINKPIEALEEDIEVIFMDKELPWLFIPWSKQERKHFSEDSKDFPRDSKGRFSKDPLLTP